jgi:integrase
VRPASRKLSLASAPAPVRRVHADRAAYKSWIYEHCASYAVRWARMDDYDRFVEHWPALQDWFDAPLRQRLLDKENCVRGQHPHGGASVIMPYLTYLSLVEGIGLDYPVLLARTFTSPFRHQMRYGGLGLDHDVFDRHVTRLEQLGYANGAAQLTWPLGRMLLHRGDANLSALGMEDLREFREEIDAFTARLRLEPLREFYARAPVARPPGEIARSYFASSIAKLHAVHVLLFHVGQVSEPPHGRVNAGSWADHLAPEFAPPTVRAVIERYLRLHLQANLDRPQTVRHFRDALRRLVTWMAAAHPEMTSLAELHREHAEEFLRWLGIQTSQHTGAPLSVSFRRSIVTLITRFVTETAAWGWDDVPARVLFSRADIPKITHPVPRFIPDHELAALMTAIDQLPGPYQRAALIVARWSGARRDEIRRLAVDCLDTYPGGHPRLRIPVGKGYTERMIPLHPRAAEALQLIIDLARQQHARKRFDPSAGRPVQHVFLVRGKLLSNAFLFDLSLKAACTAAGLVDSAGRPSALTGSATRSAPSSPRAAPASRRSWPCSAGRRTCRSSTQRCPTRRSSASTKTRSAGTSDRTSPSLARLPTRCASTASTPRRCPGCRRTCLRPNSNSATACGRPPRGRAQCDLVLTCSKFLTTSDYTPRLRARLHVEQQLIDDATARGWDREAERHQAARQRLLQLLEQLGESQTR